MKSDIYNFRVALVDLLMGTRPYDAICPMDLADFGGVGQASSMEKEIDKNHGLATLASSYPMQKSQKLRHVSMHEHVLSIRSFLSL